MLHCPRTIARTIVYSGIFLTTGLSSALAADPTGDWKVADGVANIRVAQCSGNMWGVVAWEKTPGGKDKNNPDASKQSRPTLGMPILIDMKKKSGGSTPAPGAPATGTGTVVLPPAAATPVKD